MNEAFSNYRGVGTVGIILKINSNISNCIYIFYHVKIKWEMDIPMVRIGF